VDIVRVCVRGLAAAMLLLPGLACGTSTSEGPSDGGLGAEVGAVARDGGEDSGVDWSAPPFCVDSGPTQNPCIAADIHASNYDQSCQKDSDCVLVVEGYACGSCSVCAPLSAINDSAVSQYEADVAKVVGPPPMGGGGCAPCCGPILLPCCQGGQCHADIPSSSGTGYE
jgi:hypothetical protein